jgi:hypothetical protein
VAKPSSLRRNIRLIPADGSVREKRTGGRSCSPLCRRKAHKANQVICEPGRGIASKGKYSVQLFKEAPKAAARKRSPTGTTWRLPGRFIAAECPNIRAGWLDYAIALVFWLEAISRRRCRRHDWELIPPEILEPVGRQLCIADRVQILISLCRKDIFIGLRACGSPQRNTSAFSPRSPMRRRLIAITGGGPPGARWLRDQSGSRLNGFRS